MKLIGYFERFSDANFAIPIYGDGSTYFHHILDHQFRIEAFQYLKPSDHIIIDNTLTQNYEIGDIGPIVLTVQNRTFVGIANLMIYEVKEFNRKYKNSIIDEELDFVSDQLNIDISEDLDNQHLHVIREILRMYNSDYFGKDVGNVLVESDDKYDLNYGNLRKAVQVLRSLNHKLRLILLQKIAEAESPTVNDLAKVIRIDQSVLKQHLAILRRSNLILFYRNPNKDKSLTTSLNFEWIETVFKIIKYLAE